jgi:hypothetical protein
LKKLKDHKDFCYLLKNAASDVQLFITTQSIEAIDGILANEKNSFT